MTLRYFVKLKLTKYYHLADDKSKRNGVVGSKIRTKIDQKKKF